MTIGTGELLPPPDLEAAIVEVVDRKGRYAAPPAEA
jgi:hypothetical protein